jgi:multicomponent Na+:H+ antiporter subunit B
MKWLLLVLMVGMVGLFGYVSADLPDRADPNSPANEHLAGEFIKLTDEEIEIPNVVSAILADFRSYDTLGETFVIFTAGLAVLLVLQRGYKRND